VKDSLIVLGNTKAHSTLSGRKEDLRVLKLLVHEVLNDVNFKNIKLG
jgi:hypothetical protein